MIKHFHIFSKRDNCNDWIWCDVYSGATPEEAIEKRIARFSVNMIKEDGEMMLFYRDNEGTDRQMFGPYKVEELPSYRIVLNA